MTATESAPPGMPTPCRCGRGSYMDPAHQRSGCPLADDQVQRLLHTAGVCRERGLGAGAQEMPDHLADPDIQARVTARIQTEHPLRWRLAEG